MRPQLTLGQVCKMCYRWISQSWKSSFRSIAIGVVVFGVYVGISSSCHVGIRLFATEVGFGSGLMWFGDLWDMNGARPPGRILFVDSIPEWCPRWMWWTFAWNQCVQDGTFGRVAVHQSGIAFWPIALAVSAVLGWRLGRVCCTGTAPPNA